MLQCKYTYYYNKLDIIKLDPATLRFLTLVIFVQNGVTDSNWPIQCICAELCESLWCIYNYSL